MTPSGERIVIDWTESGRGPRLAGLANMLSHPVHAHADTWFDDTVIEAIIGGYTQHVRLQPNELERLGSAILVRAARDITAGMEGHMPNEELAHEIAAKVRALL